jgi:hypothetical protein
MHATAIKPYVPFEVDDSIHSNYAATPAAAMFSPI